ncbi:MAG: tetratricopeptide repeat protein [Chloroflexaceae bacterium]
MSEISRPTDPPGSVAASVATVGPRQPRVRWLIIVLVVTLLTALLARPLLAAAYLSYGSYALAQARAAPDRPDMLAQATAALEQASAVTPGNALALRRLAEAHTLAGRDAAAIDALKRALQLQPDSLLIRMQLAEVYNRIGRREERDALYAFLGYTPDRLVSYADMFFVTGRHEDALLWYNQALEALGSLPGDAAFRRLLASLSISPDMAVDDPFVPDGLIHHLTRSQTLVAGGDLRLLLAMADLGVPYGMVLSQAFERTGNTNPSPSGMLWLASSAGLVVSATEPGTYLLRVTARHRGPAPARLRIGLDGSSLSSVEVAPPEGEWQIVEQPVTLDHGAHLLSLSFTNPLFISGGEDRKLEIATVELKRLPE